MPLAADADRATVGRISVQLAAQAKAAGMHVKGCAAAWSVCSPAGAQVAVWVEFSATQIAEASIPAWCRAPRRPQGRAARAPRAAPTSVGGGMTVAVAIAAADGATHLPDRSAARRVAPHNAASNAPAPTHAGRHQQAPRGAG